MNGVQYMYEKYGKIKVHKLSMLEFIDMWNHVRENKTEDANKMSLEEFGQILFPGVPSRFIGGGLVPPLSNAEQYAMAVELGRKETEGVFLPSLERRFNLDGVGQTKISGHHLSHIILEDGRKYAPMEMEFTNPYSGMDKKLLDDIDVNTKGGVRPTTNNTPSQKTKRKRRKHGKK